MDLVLSLATPNNQVFFFTNHYWKTFAALLFLALKHRKILLMEIQRIALVAFYTLQCKLAIWNGIWSKTSANLNVFCHILFTFAIMLNYFQRHLRLEMEVTNNRAAGNTAENCNRPSTCSSTPMLIEDIIRVTQLGKGGWVYSPLVPIVYMLTSVIDSSV